MVGAANVFEPFFDQTYIRLTPKAADTNDFEQHELHTMNPKGVLNLVSDQPARYKCFQGRCNVDIHLDSRIVSF